MILISLQTTDPKARPRAICTRRGASTNGQAIRCWVDSNQIRSGIKRPTESKQSGQSQNIQEFLESNLQKFSKAILERKNPSSPFSIKFDHVVLYSVSIRNKVSYLIMINARNDLNYALMISRSAL